VEGLCNEFAENQFSGKISKGKEVMRDDWRQKEFLKGKEVIFKKKS